MVNSPERFAIAKWMPALLVGGLVASLAAALLLVLAEPRGERGPRLSRASLRTHRARRRDARAGGRRRARRRASVRAARRIARDARARAGRDREGPLAVRGALHRERAPPRRRAGLERAARDFAAGARRARSRGRAQEVRGGVARHPRPRAGGHRQCRVGAGRCCRRCASCRASRPSRSAPATTSSSSRPR